METGTSPARRASRERSEEPTPVPDRLDGAAQAVSEDGPLPEAIGAAGQDTEAGSGLKTDASKNAGIATEPKAETAPQAAETSEQKAEAAQSVAAPPEEKAEAPKQTDSPSEKTTEAAQQAGAPDEQKTEPEQRSESAANQKVEPVQTSESPTEQTVGASQDTESAPVQTAASSAGNDNAQENQAGAAANAGETREAKVSGGAISELTSPPQTAALTEKDDGLGKIIGQMIAVGFDGTRPDQPGPQRIISELRSGKIGGVVFTSRNVRSPSQLRALIEALKAASPATPPFLMITQEGGTGQALSAEKGFSMYPSASELGRSNDPLNAFSVYDLMAEELASFGFNVNLGPVVDLDQKDDGASTDEGRRFGASPKHVAAFAKAFRLAHQQNGVLTALKYFPRQAGPASEAASGTAAENDRNDAALETYRELIASETVDMVMTSHLSDAHFSDEPGLPASLSVKAIQKRLRGEIGFQGVVISVDLGDPALPADLSRKERIRRAIGAGTDILLIGTQIAPGDEVVETIVTAVREGLASGAFSRKDLEASYARIVRLKQSLDASGNAIASVDAQQGAQKPTNAR